MPDLKGLEALLAMIEARRAMAKQSMETGVARHGDLTQLDRQISEMAEGLDRAARREPDGGRSR